MPGAFDVDEMKLSTRVAQSTTPGRKGLRAQVLAVNCLRKGSSGSGEGGRGNEGWHAELLERVFWRSEDEYRPG